MPILSVKYIHPRTAHLRISGTGRHRIFLFIRTGPFRSFAPAGPMPQGGREGHYHISMSVRRTSLTKGLFIPMFSISATIQNASLLRSKPYWREWGRVGDLNSRMRICSPPQSLYVNPTASASIFGIVYQLSVILTVWTGRTEDGGEGKKSGRGTAGGHYRFFAKTHSGKGP